MIGSLLSSRIDTLVWTAAAPTNDLPTPKMLVTIGITHFTSKLAVEEL